MPQTETRKRPLHPVDSTDGESGRRPKRRIVPNELRKRTGKSCDLCKTRRIKCVRPMTEDGENTNAPCQNCTTLQLTCQSALPRKTRIYGSLESLSARHRLLEGLVKALFPGRDMNNNYLIEIAREYGISIPDPNPSEMPSTLAQALDSDNPQVPLLPPAPVTESTSRPNGHCSNFVENHPYTTSNTTSYLDRENRSPQTFPQGRAGTAPISPGMIDSQDEHLYPNTQGVMSYLGPSSSFEFIVVLRRLVSRIGNSAMARDLFPSGRESMAIEDGLEEPEEDNNRPFQRSLSEEAVNASMTQHEVAMTASIPAQDRDNSLADNRAGIDPRPSSDSGRSRSSFHADDMFAGGVNMNQDSLPPREVSDMLIEAFFDYVHRNYVIFHRSLFQMQYEGLFLTSDNVSDKEIDKGWTCCVYMAFVFGYQALKHWHPDQAPVLQRNYIKLAQSHLNVVLNTTSISNIQALLLMQLYHHNSGARNASWMLLGCACRMAISMGMHREGAHGGSSPIVRELRRRIWWTMYTFEKQLSLTLGRPSAIPEDGEVNVKLPNENFMDGKTHYPSGLLSNMLSLTDILIKIRKSFFAAAEAPPAADRGLALAVSKIPCLEVDTVRSIILQLDDWFHGLPPNHQLLSNAKGSNDYRAVHLLHLVYYHAKQVVTRSYLLLRLEAEITPQHHTKKSNTTLGSSNQEELSQVCVDAAISSSSIIESLWNSNQVDGVAWLDIYWAYHSGVMLLIELLREQQGVGQKTNSTGKTRDIVCRLIEVMQKAKLCKTMRVFANMTMALARIVGVHAEDQEGLNDVDFSQLTATIDVTNSLGDATVELNMESSWPFNTLPYADILDANDWVFGEHALPGTVVANIFDESG